MKKIQILILLMGFLFQNSIAQVTLPPAISDSIFANTAVMNEWLADNQVATLGLGIINEGELKEIRVFGKLNEEKPAPYNAIFNVASLTKPVVATLTLKLVEAGKWDLDESLNQYWIDPDVKDDPRHKKLTTRHILSHQSGFSNWRRNDESQKLVFNFDPGTEYNYSGEGFEYLKKAIENKLQIPLEVLAKEYLFDPIGMTDTNFSWDGTWDESRFVEGYKANGEIYDTHKNTRVSAADDLHTTIEDYSNFLCHVMEGADLSEQLFQDMVSAQVATKKGKSFGLGWEIYHNLGNDEYALSHGGSDVGVQTLVFMLPNSKQGLVIFTNTDNAHQKIFLPIILHYLKERGKEIFDIEMGNQNPKSLK